MKFKDFTIYSTVFVLISLTVVQAQAQAVGALCDKEKVELDKTVLTIPNGFTKHLRWNLLLDSMGANGSSITWKSAKPQFLSDQGKLLKRSSSVKRPEKVRMTATISSGNIKSTKTFNIQVAAKEQKYDAYLFAYFEGSGQGDLQEQLRFGVSSDAVNWTALNNNQPILSSASISQTGGIRDPHILRAENGRSFYMVATDMFTKKNGWGHNPGIVMLNSDDLIGWKHSIIDLEKLYPQKFTNVQWVWAPQTIYDPAVDKYLVYFTVRLKDDAKLDFYSAYANRDFSGFENEPQLSSGQNMVQ